MHRLFIVLALILAPLVAAESTADALARLVAGTVDAGELRTWQRLWNADDRLLITVIEAERANDWQRCCTVLAPILEQSGEARKRQAFLTTTLAEALARDGQSERARHLLGEALHSDTAISRAAATAVAGRLALLNRDWEAAEQHVQQARAMLRRVDGSSDGMGWSRTLTDRRLDALARELETAADIERLGEDFVAWRDADQRAGEAPIGSAHGRYLAVAERFPSSRIAAPALLASAQQRFVEGDAVGCVAALKPLLAERNAEQHGLVCLLAADAALRWGQLDNVTRLCNEAITWSIALTPATGIAIPVTHRAALVPDGPPHQFGNWGSPVWQQRKIGHIWTRTTAPWLGSYIMHQATVRLATAAYLQGDGPVAIALAKRLATLDDIDRAMVEDDRSAGPRILAASFVQGDFHLPAAAWKTMPKNVRTPLLMSLVWFDLYDWRSARLWSDIARDQLPSPTPAQRNAFTYLSGLIAWGLEDRSAALHAFQAVKLGPGQPPDQVWADARMGEFQLLQQRSQVPLRDALPPLLEVVEKSADTPFGERALMLVVSSSEYIDPVLCRSAAKRFITSYPKSIYIPFVRAVLSRIEDPNRNPEPP